MVKNKWAVKSVDSNKKAVKICEKTTFKRESKIEVKIEVGIEIEKLPENSRSKTRYALKN